MEVWVMARGRTGDERFKALVVVAVALVVAVVAAVVDLVVAVVLAAQMD